MSMYICSSCIGQSWAYHIARNFEGQKFQSFRGFCLPLQWNLPISIALLVFSFLQWHCSRLQVAISSLKSEKTITLPLQSNLSLSVGKYSHLLKIYIHEKFPKGKSSKFWPLNFLVIHAVLALVLYI